MTAYSEGRVELHEALKEFSSSARFNFLKTLRVGPLLGEDATSLGAISEMTFEELVSSVDSHSSELHKLSSAQERMLTALLRALSEKESSGAQSPEPAGSPREGERDSDEVPTTPTTFNSLQSQIELREQVSALRGHPDVDRIKDMPLGHFWSPDSPRAPFEETITIKQLFGLDVAILAKKRSMTSIRMHAISRAVANARTLLENGGVELESAERAPERELLASDISGRIQRHRWMGHYDWCSPREMALVESVIRGCSDDERHADTVRGALHHFCAAFTVADFLKIVSGEALPSATQRKLQAWANSGSLRRAIPLLHGILQGPGTHISTVTKVLQGNDALQAFHGIAGMLIVRGLGAREVCVDGRTCPDVWSCNPALVPLMYHHAQLSKQGTPSQALDSICPQMDPFLHQWLQGVFPLPKRGKKRRIK